MIVASISLGALLNKFKVPGGFLIGGIIATTIISINIPLYLPIEFKVLAQIMAGTYIGTTIDINRLNNIKYLIKPTVFLMTGYLFMNLAVGFIIYLTSPLDLSTALFSCVPGGVSDMPILAQDMGATASIVTFMQFFRLVYCITVLPFNLRKLSYAAQKEADKGQTKAKDSTVSKAFSSDKILVVVSGLALGIFGRISGIPTGAMLFSLIGTLLYKKFCNKNPKLPKKFRVVAQLLSGAYIGSGIQMDELLALDEAVIPLIILLVSYTIFFFIMKMLLNRFCNLSKYESILVSIPAGANDLSLIAADLGVETPTVAVMQMLRLMIVIIFFPQIINIILLLTGFPA